MQKTARTKESKQYAVCTKSFSLLTTYYLLFLLFFFSAYCLLLTSILL